jgi:PAS domain S-box-containing protein
VTEAKETALALRESDEKLRLALAATDLGVWSWDLNADRITWDEVTLRHYGVAQPPERYEDFVAIVHPDDRARVDRSLRVAVESGNYPDLEHRVVRADGSIRWILCKGAVQRGSDGRVNRLFGGALDVTERRRLEEQLRQSQKMEAVGQLTAGIAHNFNNLLTAIGPNIDLVLERLGPENAEELADARQAVGRAVELVRQLMVFAQRDPGGVSLRLVEPRQIVESALDICRRTFERRIRIGLDGVGPSAPVLADSKQLEQALMNVLLNARDALDRTSEPEIKVLIDVVAASAVARPRPGVDQYVLIRIADNGCGMDVDSVERCFEPFFTTKGVGRGTGLGLATTYAIAEEHGGWAACRSEAGVGSAFSLYLPIADHDATGALVIEPGPAVRHVLIVDDEELVRRTLERMLVRGGYGVVLADGGDTALRVFDRDRADIAVAVIDLSMSDLSGVVLARALTERNPALKKICLTGFATETVPAEDFHAVLQKPASRRALLAAVERLIGPPELTY